MGKKNPNQFPSFSAELPTYKDRYERLMRKPRIGVSQGGSGRKNAGCRTAATQTPKE